MKIAFCVCHALALLALACAPSKDIESPADPPGIEKEDGSRANDSDSEASASFEAEAEAEAESESGE